MCKRIYSLDDMSSTQEMPALTEMKANLDYQFAQASELADQLDHKVEDFTTQRSTLEEDMEQQANWVNQVRDKLSSIDDIIGADEDMVSKLNTAKVLSRLPQVTTYNRLFKKHIDNNVVERRAGNSMYCFVDVTQ